MARWKYMATPWFGGRGNVSPAEDLEAEEQRVRLNRESIQCPIDTRQRSPGSSPELYSDDSGSRKVGDIGETVEQVCPLGRFFAFMHRIDPSIAIRAQGYQGEMYFGALKGGSTNAHDMVGRTSQRMRAPPSMVVGRAQPDIQSCRIFRTQPPLSVDHMQPHTRNLTANQYFNPVFPDWCAPVSGSMHMQSYGRPPGLAAPWMTQSAPSCIIWGDSPEENRATNRRDALAARGVSIY